MKNYIMLENTVEMLHLKFIHLFDLKQGYANFICNWPIQELWESKPYVVQVDLWCVNILFKIS